MTGDESRRVMDRGSKESRATQQGQSQHSVCLGGGLGVNVGLYAHVHLCVEGRGQPWKLPILVFETHSLTGT